MSPAHLARSRPDAQILYYRRRIVHCKTLAFAFGRKHSGRRICRRIQGDDFQIIGAVRKRRGIEGIKPLVQLVFHQLPRAFIFSAIVNGKLEFILVVVMSSPDHRSIAFFPKTLRRLFKAIRGRTLRDGDSRDSGGSGHSYRNGRWLARGHRLLALRADARVLNRDAINHRGNIARKIRQAHPINAVTGAAVVDDRFPLRKPRRRSFRGCARLGVRAKPARPFLSGIIRVPAAHKKLDARIVPVRGGGRTCA